MEYWKKEEVDTLCNELEKLVGFECCDRYYDYDTIEGEDTYITFVVHYLGVEVFQITIEGYTCRNIYEDKKMLNELHSKITKHIKLWKINRAKKKIEKDFEEETDNDNK